MRNLSLFTGSGIGDLAAKAAGIETVAMCESDPACCYCLERLWPGVRLFRDVHDVTAESVADLGPIDIISGGFPCQDISTAGKGAGLGTEEKKTRSGLWYEFARVIREVRPAWLLIENVPALRVRGGDRVTNDLEAMAYEWEAVVVGADDVGAPHKRKRVWIIGRLENTASTRRTQAGVESRDRQRANSNTQRGFRECESGNASGTELADTIGNLRGSGGNESERGPERRTAAGRAGEELGHPASDDKRRAPIAAMHWEGEQAGGSSGGELADGTRQQRDERTNGDGARAEGDGKLADGNSQGLPQPVCKRSDPPEEQSPVVRSRWPARPGEPQHDWEAPRLVEFGLGDAVDGVSRRVRSRANKALLRMAGNAWCYQVAELMFRGIVELDKEQP